ncbi:MAG: hypothetical protein U0Z26_06790 [Anaerolineales bacterium]
MKQTAEKAIAAYGGREFWSKAKRIEAEVSTHGLAFTIKSRPIFKRAKISMEIARPFSKLMPIGKNTQLAGVIEGHHVRLEDSTGRIVEERKDARKYFPGGLQRLFHWDELDMAYFANYAFWNYFTLPFLLMREDINWKEIEPGWLEADFPESIPTHSKIQRFRFDLKTGLLIQHDYTVDIMSKLATAANVVLEHKQGDCFVYPSRRLVTPHSPSGNALSAPILIDITVHDFQVS